MKLLNKNLLLLLFVFIIYELYKLFLMFLSLYKCPEWIMTLISIVFVILLLLFYSKKIKFKNILYINFIQILFLFKSLLLCFCLYVISTPIHCLLFDVDGLLICNMCFVSLGNLCLILSDSINAQLFFFLL